MKKKTNSKKKDDLVKYITKSTLKTRGWTDSLIKHFLPKPHKNKKNPHYSCAAPMCLYSLYIVEIIEKTEEFCIKFEKVKKRKLGAKKRSQ